jgi:hypothetical protein
MKVYEDSPQKQQALLDKPDDMIQKEDDTVYNSVEEILQIDAETAKIVPRKELVNKLNHLHFKGGILYGVLVHRTYDRKRILPLRPLPCSEKRLDCIIEQGHREGLRPDPSQETGTLENERGNGQGINNLAVYTLELLFFEDSSDVLLVPVEENHVSSRGISVVLPETCYQQSFRSMKRSRARRVRAEISQYGVSFSGTLQDFSAESFRLLIEPNGNSFHWLNQEKTVHLSLFMDHWMLYSAPCRLLDSNQSSSGISCILQATHSAISRFPPREYRSIRYTPTLPPDCAFEHPLSGTHIERKVYDISGTGFSVLDDPVEAHLLPGLILPEVRLLFANRSEITCKAQVIYRAAEPESGKVRCGVALLEIPPEEHLTLLSELHQIKNAYSYVNKPIDLEELWRFFFESGFIYPQKYVYMQKHRETIKATYEKLYGACPGFARHFVYQVDSRILAHLAMVRFYPRSWLIQHHASDTTNNHNAGVSVLNQVGSFVNDTCRFESMHMDYLICFYRPKNKFPHRVFGGIARGIKDPKKCSLDDCAYMHIHRGEQEESEEHLLWSVEEPHTEDLLDVKNYYEKISGGLMLSALNILPDSESSDELVSEYRRIGIERKSELYAVKKNDQLQALVLVNRADIGVNFSELTNSLMIFTFPHTRFPAEGPGGVLSGITEQFPFQKIPTLVFPAKFADDNSIVYEKTYTLWVLDTYHREGYFKYLNSLFRKIQC